MKWWRIVGIVIFALVFILGLRLLTSGFSFSSLLPKPTSSMVTIDPRYAFKTIQGAPYGYSMIEEKGDYLSVSGIIQSQTLEADGKITILVPTPLQPKGKTVHAFLDKTFNKQDDLLLTVKLKDGKFEPIQQWRGMKLKDIVPFLIPGRQVIVYVPMNQAEGATAVENGNTIGIVDVQPITQIIVGDFTK